MRLFRYGMRLRNYGYGNQPQTGFYALDRNLEVFRRYFDILIYTRELTRDECEHFALDFLGEVV